MATLMMTFQAARAPRESTIGGWALGRLTLIALATTILGGCAQLLGARAVERDAPEPTTFHTIVVGDEMRGFLLHRPPRSERPLPVLIVLHGSSANANVAMDESGLNPIADSLGALAVYPNGTDGIPYFRLFWNYLDCCGSGRRRPNEEAMVRALVDTLSHHFTIDRSRIGLIGFSDAGTLAYQMACDVPETLTAIGVISGEVPESRCTPRPPVSTIVFHGTADRNVPYGNTFERVADWAGRSGCSTARVDTSGSIARASYGRCGGSIAEVILYTIVGGRHAWPGGQRSWLFAPAPARNISASRVFASFVINHPREILR